MNIKTLLFAIVSAASLLELSAQETPHNESTLIKEIDMFLLREFPNDQPGAVVFISRADSIIYKKPFGLASLEKKMPLETDMIFQIASMTKQFTAVLILQLIEQDKLSLTDTIQKILDYYPKTSIITIENLLSHTSGIPEFFDFEEDERHLLTQEHSPKQLIDYFKDEPLEFTPGTKFRYSNSNYVLLGAIIEKVTGLSYADVLRKNIFEPLGMKRSALWYQSNFPKEKIPSGYSLKEGKFVSSEPITGSITYSSGGIVSTVDDLFLWNRALRNFVLLNKQSTSLLFTETTLPNHERTKHGFGFFIKELQGSPTFQHGGNLYGFTSSGLFLPHENLFVCILSNAGFQRTEEIANYIASILIEKPIEITKKADITFGYLNDFVGTYKLSSKKPQTINIGIIADRLVLTFPDQPGNEVDILPIGNDIFESKKVKAQLTFIRDANGKISGINVKQGKTYQWIKIQ